MDWKPSLLLCLTVACSPLVLAQSTTEPQDDGLDNLLGDAAASASETPAPVPPPQPAPTAVIPVVTAEPEATAQQPARKSRSRLLEEIVVTAQKREENLQDVPIAINAFSADMLDARGINDPKDLPLATPGLYVGANAGYSVTFLRGIGSDAYLLGDPSVALYIDGVYFPFAHGQAQNFGAIERIEVLKGPQGTLFGRNAVGGAISVITKAPDFTSPSGAVQVSYGKFDDLQTKAQLNIPLTDNFAVGVSALYNAADNYRPGMAGGKPLPLEVTKGARLKLRWAPIESIDLTLSGFKLLQTGVSTLFATNSQPLPAFQALITPQQAPGGENDAPDYFELDNTVFYGQATWFAQPFDVKLIGSHQKVFTAALYDFDGSPTPLVFFEIPRQGAVVKTAELQVLSNDTSWASDRLKWIVGYYYFNGLAGFDRIRFGVGQSILDGINSQLEGVTDLLGVRLPRLLPEDELVAYGKLRTDSNSVFAQGSYQFTDWFSLTLGARFQNEKRTLVNSGGSIDPPQGPDIPYTSFSGQSDTTKSLSPKVSLDFRPWEDGLIYLSYQSAVKSSTYNVVNFLNFAEPTPIAAEKLKAYEAGLKTTLFDGSTTLSSAVFFYQIKNQQSQFLSLLAGGAVNFESVPAAEVKGIDFDITSQIFPSVTPGLVFTIGGALLDPKYTDFPNGQGFDELTGLYTRANYTGKQITRSPKLSGNVGLSQTFDIPGGALEIAGDYYYNSGFYYLPQNTDFNHENAYGVLGAHVSYLYERWGLRTTAFGKNLTDAKYNYSRFTNDFGALDATAPPISYGVRMSWEF